MKDKAKDILVEEVMSPDPYTTRFDLSAQDAAKLMRSVDVGSLVVMEDGEAVGIITEKDLVQKIVAQGRTSSRVKVKDIMSSPLITVGPKMSVADAARKMAEHKLRRLPVVDQGKLVGVLTENDILRLSPSLIELTREWSRLGASGGSLPRHLSIEGYCENCGAYSLQLLEYEGELLCAECLDQIGSLDEEA